MRAERFSVGQLFRGKFSFLAHGRCITALRRARAAAAAAAALSRSTYRPTEESVAVVVCCGPSPSSASSPPQPPSLPPHAAAAAPVLAVSAVWQRRQRRASASFEGSGTTEQCGGMAVPTGATAAAWAHRPASMAILLPAGYNSVADGEVIQPAPSPARRPPPQPTAAQPPRGQTTAAAAADGAGGAAAAKPGRLWARPLHAHAAHSAAAPPPPHRDMRRCWSFGASGAADAASQ